MNFFEKYLNSKVRAEELYDYEDEWFKSDTGLTPYEYLGMTAQQYIIFKKFLNFTNTKK